MKPQDLVQAYTLDKQKLAELVIKAKGKDRTMAQFAVDTGISAPTLSRIANGKINNPLNPDTLVKIFEARSSEANFTLDMLLLANGMVEQRTVEKSKEYIERFSTARDKGIDLERHAKNAIVNALLERGIGVQSIPADMNVRKNEAPYGIATIYDFTLYLPNEPQQYWYFDVINSVHQLPHGMGNTFAHVSRLFLLDAWEPSFLANQKTCFVFEWRGGYEQFLMQYQNAPIHSAVSAILINPNDETVIEETWLSRGYDTPSIFERNIVDAPGNIAAWDDEDFFDDCVDERFQD